MLETIDTLLKTDGKQQCVIPDVDGDLALHRAVYKRVNVEVISRLIECYPKSVNVPNKEGDRAIDVAFKRDGSKEVVEFLFEKMKGEGREIVNPDR